ncbi:MAG: hypothetical protein CM15mP49_33890 [Actinomycetota bacterium]|nr:MAG: hypothetical protein CM15mP49_33890 [Actinomycetota bacterium]
MGTVSTGDSLDSQPSDLDFMNSVTAVAKDMEAARGMGVCAEGSAFYCAEGDDGSCGW